MDKVYKQNTKTGEYIDYQLNTNIFEKSIPLCFKCMAPISKIARYGRVLNILNLCELGRKYLVQAHDIGNEFLEIANSRKEKYSSIPYTKIKGKLDYFLSIDPCENINSLDIQVLLLKTIFFRLLKSNEIKHMLQLMNIF